MLVARGIYCLNWTSPALPADVSNVRSLFLERSTPKGGSRIYFYPSILSALLLVDPRLVDAILTGFPFVFFETSTYPTQRLQAPSAIPLVVSLLLISYVFRTARSPPDSFIRDVNTAVGIYSRPCVRSCCFNLSVHYA